MGLFIFLVVWIRWRKGDLLVKDVPQNTKYKFIDPCRAQRESEQRTLRKDVSLTCCLTNYLRLWPHTKSYAVTAWPSPDWKGNRCVEAVQNHVVLNRMRNGCSLQYVSDYNLYTCIYLNLHNSVADPHLDHWCTYSLSLHYPQIPNMAVYWALVIDGHCWGCKQTQRLTHGVNLFTDSSRWKGTGEKQSQHPAGYIQRETKGLMLFLWEKELRYIVINPSDNRNI